MRMAARDLPRQTGGKQARAPRRLHARRRLGIVVDHRHLTIAHVQPLARANRAHGDDVIQRNFHHAGRAVAQPALQHKRFLLERIRAGSDRPPHKQRQRHHRVEVKQHVEQPHARRRNQQIADNLRQRKPQHDGSHAQRKSLARHRARPVHLLRANFLHHRPCPPVNRPPDRFLP